MTKILHGILVCRKVNDRALSWINSKHDFLSVHFEFTKLSTRCLKCHPDNLRAKILNCHFLWEKKSSTMYVTRLQAGPPLIKVNNFQKVPFGHHFIKNVDRFFYTAVKFRFSKKVTKFEKNHPLKSKRRDLFIKFCGLLRIYEV